MFKVKKKPPIWGSDYGVTRILDKKYRIKGKKKKNWKIDKTLKKREW